MWFSHVACYCKQHRDDDEAGDDDDDDAESDVLIIVTIMTVMMMMMLILCYRSMSSYSRGTTCSRHIVKTSRRHVPSSVHSSASRWRCLSLFHCCLFYYITTIILVGCITNIQGVTENIPRNICSFSQDTERKGANV